MIKLIFSCIIFLLTIVTDSKAQNLQHYTIFPMNRIFAHPAYAGIEARKAAQVYFQYIGFDNNINVYSFQKNHNIQYSQHEKREVRVKNVDNE